MERTEIVERKLSKKSIWGRRSSKRSSTTPASQQPQQRAQEEQKEMDKVIQQHKEQLPASDSNRSVVPDVLKDIPSWYKENWNSSTYYRSKFPLHNPVGPRYYRNHHLIPCTNGRPPTVFSPSFPPMTSFMPPMPERSEQLSRTPSHQTLPTPSSSQTRVEDMAAKPRSRKTSQTAHDGVDLMDGTDPWGTNWHHGSPYDIGLSNGPVSQEVEVIHINSIFFLLTSFQSAQNRSRRSSTTTKETRRRTLTPSPLSQSTSALHLQVQDAGARIPRKLSKRRTSILGNFFHADHKNAVSQPTLPETDLNRASQTLEMHVAASKRSSTLPPPVPKPPSDKTRRGSVLGRLVKKFSLIKKSGDDDLIIDDKRQTVLLAPRQPSPVKSQKRVPPPQMPRSDTAFSVERNSPPSENPPKEPDRDSFSSVEQPFSIGKLTVANPDAPSEPSSTPAEPSVPLPSFRDENPKPQDQQMTTSSRGETPDALSVTSAPTDDVSNSDKPPTLRSIAVSLQPTLQHSRSGPIVEMIPPPVQNVVPPLEAIQLVEETSAKPLAPPAFDTDRQSRPRERQKRPPSTQKSHDIPFPAVEPAVPHYLSSMISAHGYDQADGSPLSTASIIANPPTPHAAGQTLEPEPLPPALPPKQSSAEGKRSQRDPSPDVNSVTSRKTETFRLVRSSSGNVYASSETIRAAGEQWEVIEAVNSGSRSKSRDERKENRRLDVETDSERRRVKSGQKGHKHSVDIAVPSPDKNKPLPRASSVESHRLPYDSTKNHKREEERRRSAEPTPLNLNKPQPAPPPPTPGPPAMRPLERAPSNSARPTSEVPSSADFNALRAREAWEMDRLWKARSLYGNETNGLVAPLSVNVPSGIAMNETGTSKGVHGSSHTSFTVQNSFQSQPPGSHIYHSMPAVPPPIIYSNQPQTYPESHDTHPLLANPLPEPPRESPYQPAPLPHNFMDSNSVRATEHWTKYGGFTAPQ